MCTRHYRLSWRCLSAGCPTGRKPGVDLKAAIGRHCGRIEAVLVGWTLAVHRQLWPRCPRTRSEFWRAQE